MLSVMMAVVMSTGFIACSSDDDPDEVTVYPPQVSFGTEGGQQMVTIKSNTKWTITGMMAGVTVAPTQGNGDGTITLIASANTDNSLRNGTFMVNAGSASAMISVSQTAKVPETKVTITNNSTYTLSRFRVIFLNVRGEQLTDRDFGTLDPGMSISADIPTSATEYYMATYLNSRWFFSPNYDVTYTNLSLGTAEIGNWSANSSSRSLKRSSSD